MKEQPAFKKRIDFSTTPFKFDGTVEELHAYIDELNEAVVWMNANFERFLTPEELHRLTEIRDWFIEDGADFTADGWPSPIPSDPGSQAFAYLREVSTLHRVAEERMGTAD